MPSLRYLAALAATAAVSACAPSAPGTGVTGHLSFRVISMNSALTSAIAAPDSCLFIHVSAADPEFPRLGEMTRNPQCTDAPIAWGILSPLVPGDAASIQLEVPVGPGRRFDLLAVSKNLMGGACVGRLERSPVAGSDLALAALPLPNEAIHVLASGRGDIGPGDNLVDLQLLAATAAGAAGYCPAPVVDPPPPPPPPPVADDVQPVAVAAITTGTVTTGAGVQIRLTYASPMQVSGSPKLLIQAGGAARVATYLSGSGSTNLIFQYVVQSADAGALIIQPTINLNGGSIVEIASGKGAAIAIAPAIISASSVIFDTGGPVVTQVIATPAAGYLAVGATVDVSVEFNENVLVGGSPSISININGTAITVPYYDHPVANVMRFRHVVASGENTPDLDLSYPVSMASFASVTDTAGNPVQGSMPAQASAGSLGATSAVVIDTIAPTISGTVTDGTYSLGGVTPTIALSGSGIDSGSGIEHYEFAIGTAPGTASLVAWTNTNLAQTFSSTSAGTTDGVAYYGSVRAVDRAGNVSAPLSGDGWYADSTAPSQPASYPVIVSDSDSYQYIVASWSPGSDVGSGVAGYRYSMGTSSGGSQIKANTDTPGTSATIGGFTLLPGMTYFLNVRTVDNVGNVSPAKTTSFTTWNGGVWTPASTATNNPTPRSNLSKAVWTGSDFFVWGGFNASALSNGARYNPSLNSWSPINATGTPSARYDHQTVALPGKVEIFGGNSPNSSSAWYDTSLNSWTGNPSALLAIQWSPPVVLASKILFLSGLASNSNNVLSFDTSLAPSPSAWTNLGSLPGAPTGRQYHTSTLLSSGRILVWGGYDPGPTDTGAVFDPVANTWTPISTFMAPSPRAYHMAAEIGSDRVLIFGGWAGAGPAFNDGAIYDVSSDTWEPISDAPFAGRISASYAWDGARFIVWGGDNQAGGIFNDGAVYNPISDYWAPMAPSPLANRRLSATGYEPSQGLFIWGGDQYPTFYNDGARYQR